MRAHSGAARPSTAVPRWATSLKLHSTLSNRLCREVIMVDQNQRIRDSQICKKLTFLSKHNVFRVRLATTIMFKDHCALAKHLRFA